MVGFCDRCGKRTETRCSACKDTFYCSRECQKKSWKAHKLSCGKDTHESEEYEDDRFEEVPDEADEADLDLKVEVRESSGRGLAVFATRPVLKGQKLCYFRGSDRDAKMKVVCSRSPEGVVSIRNAREVFSRVRAAADEVDSCLAHPDSKKRVVRIGDVDSRAGFGVGQFVNDFCAPEVRHLDFGAGVKEMERYRAESIKGSNCELRSDFWFVSTRDVEAGEEVFTHYGIEFWLNKFMLESVDPSWRFLYYSLQDQTAKPFDLRHFFDYDEDTCRYFLTVLIGLSDEAVEVDKAKGIICSLTEKIKI